MVVTKSYKPSLRARVMEYVAEHGITAAASNFGVTRFSIYNWSARLSSTPEQGEVQPSHGQQ